MTASQDWVGGGQVPISPRPSGRLSGQLSSQLSVEQLQAAASLEPKEEGGLAPKVPWYKQRSLQLVLAGYASIAFLMNFLEELTPIYASAPYRLVSAPFPCMRPVMSDSCLGGCCWVLALSWCNASPGTVLSRRVKAR